MTWSLLGRCLTPATSSPQHRLSPVHWLKLLSYASIQHRDGRQNQSWHFISYQLDWYSDICLASGNLLYDLSIHVWVRILAWWCPSATIKAWSLDHNSDCALQIFWTDWRNFMSVRVWAETRVVWLWVAGATVTTERFSTCSDRCEMLDNKDTIDSDPLLFGETPLTSDLSKHTEIHSVLRFQTHM